MIKPTGYKITWMTYQLTQIIIQITIYDKTQFSATCLMSHTVRLLCPWDSPGKNTGAGCQALLQGIFLTQRLTPGVLCLPHWQKDALPLAPPGKAHLYVNSYNKLTFKSKSFVSEILFEGFIFVQVIFLCLLTTAMLTSLSLSFFFFF